MDLQAGSQGHAASDFHRPRRGGRGQFAEIPAQQPADALQGDPGLLPFADQQELFQVAAGVMRPALLALRGNI
jgi:hypothetical protein